MATRIERLHHLVLSLLHRLVPRGDSRVAKALLGNVGLTALLGHIEGVIEVGLRVLPLILIVADVRHAEQAFELHAHGTQVFCNLDALHEVVLCLLHISFKQVCDGQLSVAQ